MNELLARSAESFFSWVLAWARGEYVDSIVLSRQEKARRKSILPKALAHIETQKTFGKKRVWRKVPGSPPDSLHDLYFVSKDGIDLIHQYKQWGPWMVIDGVRTRPDSRFGDNIHPFSTNLNPRAYWDLYESCWMVETLLDPLEVLAEAELD